MLEKIWFWVIVISIIIVGIVIISESTKSIENKQNYGQNYPKTQEITETETPWDVASEIFKLQAEGKILDWVENLNVKFKC
jgi:cell division protein FtsL